MFKHTGPSLTLPSAHRALPFETQLQPVLPWSLRLIIFITFAPNRKVKVFFSIFVYLAHYFPPISFNIIFFESLLQHASYILFPHIYSIINPSFGFLQVFGILKSEMVLLAYLCFVCFSHCVPYCAMSFVSTVIQLSSH